jgi:hypothetical protein
MKYVQIGGKLLTPQQAAFRLRSIKLLHTAVWAVFAGSIIAIPFLAWFDAWRITMLLIALVSAECLVLAANGMRCPLTAVAARYTEDRRDNFDIYLPIWLAKYNKQIFGTWFLLGLAIAIIRWFS